MARRPRSFAAGVYHVAAHGSDERHPFLDDDDRRAFLERLGLTSWRLGVELISYVLMSNHHHTLAWTPDGRLSDALRQFHDGCSLAHNQRHSRHAHLFRAHCLARRIAADTDLLTTCRYLALNPGVVRCIRGLTDAALVDSSYVCHREANGPASTSLSWVRAT